MSSNRQKSIGGRRVGTSTFVLRLTRCSEERTKSAGGNKSADGRYGSEESSGAGRISHTGPVYGPCSCHLRLDTGTDSSHTSSVPPGAGSRQVEG